MHSSSIVNRYLPLLVYWKFYKSWNAYPVSASPSYTSTASPYPPRLDYWKFRIFLYYPPTSSTNYRMLAICDKTRGSWLSDFCDRTSPDLTQARPKPDPDPVTRPMLLLNDAIAFAPAKLIASVTI